MLSAKYDWKWNIQVKQIRNTTWHKYEWKQINKSYCSHLLNKSDLRKWPPSEMRIGMKLENTAPANTISLCEQIQLVKMASSRNEDWAGDMFGIPAGPPWHFEIFCWLIWHPETCTRSIYPNMSALQCNFCSGSVIVTKLSTIWGIGNPTDFQVSWGTWLTSTQPQKAFFSPVRHLWFSPIERFFGNFGVMIRAHIKPSKLDWIWLVIDYFGG